MFHVNPLLIRLDVSCESSALSNLIIFKSYFFINNDKNSAKGYVRLGKDHRTVKFTKGHNSIKM